MRRLRALPQSETGEFLHVSLYAKDVVKLGGERTAPRTLEVAEEHPKALEERNKDVIQASFFRPGLVSVRRPL